MSINRPIDEDVLICCVTATNATLCLDERVVDLRHPIELFDQLAEVEERTTETIELVNDYRVDAEAEIDRFFESPREEPDAE